MAGGKLGDRNFDRCTNHIEILELVEGNPGVWKNEIRDLKGLGWGTVHHHVDTLLKRGELKEFQFGRKKHLFPVGVSDVDARRIATLRLPHSDSILDSLLASAAGPTELGLKINVSRKVVTSHLEALFAAGLVEKKGLHRPVYVAFSDPREPSRSFV